MTLTSDLTQSVVGKVAHEVQAWMSERGLGEAPPEPHNHPVKPGFRPTPYRYQQGCKHDDCIAANRLYYHQWRIDHPPG